MKKEYILTINNHRINIPKDIPLKPNDNLILKINIEKKCLEIMTEEEFIKRKTIFNQQIDTLLKENKITPKEQRQCKRLFFGILTIGKFTIDSNRRLYLNKRIIEMLKFKDIVYLIENDNQLEIYKGLELTKSHYRK